MEKDLSDQDVFLELIDVFKNNPLFIPLSNEAFLRAYQMSRFDDIKVFRCKSVEIYFVIQDLKIYITELISEVSAKYPHYEVRESYISAFNRDELVIAVSSEYILDHPEHDALKELIIFNLNAFNRFSRE